MLNDLVEYKNKLSRQILREEYLKEVLLEKRDYLYNSMFYRFFKTERQKKIQHLDRGLEEIEQALTFLWKEISIIELHELSKSVSFAQKKD